MRRRLTQGERNQLRRRRDDSLSLAEREGRKGVEARAAARDTARTLLAYQWDAVFYSDATEGWMLDRATGTKRHIPTLERSMMRDVGQADRYEESAAAALAIAKKDAARLARIDRPRRQESDLWILIRMCWRGWRRSRALQ